MSQYDGKTIAEIVHDYAVTRGDLSEQYARDQLVEVIEQRIARERATVLREAAHEVIGHRPLPERDKEPGAWKRGERHARHLAAFRLRTRADVEADR